MIRTFSIRCIVFVDEKFLDKINEPILAFMIVFDDDKITFFNKKLIIIINLDPEIQTQINFLLKILMFLSILT